MLVTSGILKPTKRARLRFRPFSFSRSVSTPVLTPVTALLSTTDFSEKPFDVSNAIIDHFFDSSQVIFDLAFLCLARASDTSVYTSTICTHSVRTEPDKNIPDLALSRRCLATPSETPKLPTWAKLRCKERGSDSPKHTHTIKTLSAFEGFKAYSNDCQQRTGLGSRPV